MSSIHAFFSPRGGADLQLHNMLKASDYWSPDESHIWTDPQRNAGVAKCLLINTFRSRQDHLAHHENKGLVIAANARIDNRKEIAKKLKLSLTSANNLTDSQLILYGFTYWGRDVVEHLRGDFVFAIWDQRNKKLFCARDHFGVKNLYYSEREGAIVVSNEHNAFFTSDWCQRKKLSCNRIIENIWCFGPQSLDSPQEDISTLPPAHSLEFDSSGIRINRYWHLSPKITWRHLSDDDLLAEYKLRFERAVISRLDTLFPLGSELSEGLDSSGITGISAKALGKKALYTFSYDSVEKNEKNVNTWAKTYADIEAMISMHPNLSPVWQTEQKETRYERINQARKKLHRYFGGVIPTFGERFIRSALAQERNIRVILSGWGGDHCVTSYGDKYENELFAKWQFSQLYQLLRNKQARGRGSKPMRAFARLLLSHLAPTLYFLAQFSQFRRKENFRTRMHSHILSEKWRAKFPVDSLLRREREMLNCTVQEKEQCELFELGLNNTLIECELVGRMHKIEYRFPMLDVDLVEFAHSMPSHLKIWGGIERYPIRRAIEAVTTERTCWRIKSDVAIPQVHRKHEMLLYKEILRPKLEKSALIQYFSDSTQLTRCLDYFDPYSIRLLDYLLNVEEYYQFNSGKGFAHSTGSGSTIGSPLWV